MRLLFVSQAARVVRDEGGNAYLNVHMNRRTIERYASHCDSLVMFLRDSGIRMNSQEAKAQYNPFPYDLAELVVGYNQYHPLTNWLKIKRRIEMKHKLEDAIQSSDRVIVAAASGPYANIVVRHCKRLHKQYMLMNGGFIFETEWHNKNHLGKLMAPIDEYYCKKNLRDAPYALYVTEHALQERYPCQGRSIGCSDVEVPELDDSVLEGRIRRIERLTSVTGEPAQGPEVRDPGAGKTESPGDR